MIAKNNSSGAAPALLTPSMLVGCRPLAHLTHHLAIIFGLTPEYCGKRPPEQWELWEGKPLKPYHFNRTLGAQKASSKYCQIKLVLPSNEIYESKTGCNRTLATVLWVPLNFAPPPTKRWPNYHQTMPKWTWEERSLKMMGVERFGDVHGRTPLAANC